MTDQDLRARCEALACEIWHWEHDVYVAKLEAFARECEARGIEQAADEMERCKEYGYGDNLIIAHIRWCRAEAERVRGGGMKRYWVHELFPGEAKVGTVEKYPGGKEVILASDHDQCIEKYTQAMREAVRMVEKLRGMLDRDVKQGEVADVDSWLKEHGE